MRYLIYLNDDICDDICFVRSKTNLRGVMLDIIKYHFSIRVENEWNFLSEEVIDGKNWLLCKLLSHLSSVIISLLLVIFKFKVW